MRREDVFLFVGSRKEGEQGTKGGQKGVQDDLGGTTRVWPQISRMPNANACQSFCLTQWRANTRSGVGTPQVIELTTDLLVLLLKCDPLSTV